MKGILYLGLMRKLWYRIIRLLAQPKHSASQTIIIFWCKYEVTAEDATPYVEFTQRSYRYYHPDSLSIDVNIRD